MQRAGNWLAQDGRKRLKDRDSEVSIGRLARSLQTIASKQAFVIGSVLPYARMQQQGGTIKAKKQFLAIPLKLELARRRVWPRHLKEGTLRFILGKDGRAWLKNVEKDELWYRLVNEVTLEPEPYLVESPEFFRVVKDLVLRKMRRVFG